MLFHPPITSISSIVSELKKRLKINKKGYKSAGNQQMNLVISIPGHLSILKVFWTPQKFEQRCELETL